MQRFAAEKGLSPSDDLNQWGELTIGEQRQEETRSPLGRGRWPGPGFGLRASGMQSDRGCILKADPIEFSDRRDAGCNTEFVSETEFTSVAFKVSFVLS